MSSYIIHYANRRGTKDKMVVYAPSSEEAKRKFIKNFPELKVVSVRKGD